MRIPIVQIKSVNFGVLGVLTGLSLILNILALRLPVLGLILSVFWLAWFVAAIKQWLKLKYKNLGITTTSLTVLSFFIIFGSILFYALNLGTTQIILFIMTMTFLGLIGSGKTADDQKINFTYFASIKQKIYLIFYLLFYFTAWFVLFIYRTAAPIRAPWETLPKIFFVIYFILTLILLIFNAGEESERTEKKFPIINLGLIVSYFLLTLMIAIVVYKIGYGFDPFVHRAAEKSLFELGYLWPKPFYYIGQYSLVVLLSKISGAPLAIIDKLLVPLLAALLIPLVAYAEFKKFFGNKKTLLVAACLILLFATPLFFYTVPQSLANLLLLILVFLNFSCLIKKEKIPSWQWLTLAAIFFIHPLSAVPGLIWFIFWYGNSLSARLKKIIKPLILLFAAVALPIFFSLLAKISADFSLSFNVKNLINFLESLKENILNYLPFYSPYHLVYLFHHNSLLLEILFFGAGLFYLIKKGEEKLAGNYLLLITALVIDLLLVGCINFGAVIDYEQLEFAKRFLQIITILALPIILSGIYFVLKKILCLRYGQAIIILFGSLVLTFSLYLSYPRDDAMEKGRGFAVSENDIAAVQWIGQDAGDAEYIVLANQSVSAASLQEFGFKKYYKSQCQMSNVKCQMLFYYPIPTSSPLYEIYLEMIYNGLNLKKIEKARQLTGVKTVYFVINDYWLDAKKRIAEASELAGEIQNFNGRVWAFKFE